MGAYFTVHVYNPSYFGVFLFIDYEKLFNPFVLHTRVGALPLVSNINMPILSSRIKMQIEKYANTVPKFKI